MRSQPCILGVLVAAVCAGRASADEESVAQAFERMGAVVKRDDTKPNRPVIALRFGLLNPIPETMPEVDKDDLRLFVDSHEVYGVTNAERKEGTSRSLPPPHGDQGGRCGPEGSEPAGKSPGA